MIRVPGLNFAGTRKWRRTPPPEELLTQPKLLSDWAVQAGLLDRGIEVAEDDLEAAIALREAIYRTVTARIEGRRPKSADVELLNEHGSHAQLTPRLDRTGAVRREGTPSQLLARLAADLLDLLAGPDIEKVKGCAHPGCSRLYVDSSRAQNRHWCGKVADPGDADEQDVAAGYRQQPRAPHPGSAARAAAHQVARLQCDRLGHKLQKRWAGDRRTSHDSISVASARLTLRIATHHCYQWLRRPPRLAWAAGCAYQLAV